MPETISGLEPEVESMLRERLGRGSITYILKMRSDSAEAAYHINTQALKSYLHQLQQVKGLDRLVQIGCDLDSARWTAQVVDEHPALVQRPYAHALAAAAGEERGVLRDHAETGRGAEELAAF